MIFERINYLERLDICGWHSSLPFHFTSNVSFCIFLLFDTWSICCVYLKRPLTQLFCFTNLFFTVGISSTCSRGAFCRASASGVFVASTSACGLAPQFVVFCSLIIRSILSVYYCVESDVVQKRVQIFVLGFFFGSALCIVDITSRSGTGTRSTLGC